MYLGVSPEETPAILQDDRVGSKEEPVVCGPMLKNMRKHRETPYGWTVVNTIPADMLPARILQRILLVEFRGRSKMKKNKHQLQVIVSFVAVRTCDHISK